MINQFYRFFSILFYLLIYPFLLIFLPAEMRKSRCGYSSTSKHSDIWLHAASVGEINAVLPLIKEINQKYPKKKILVSCMTRTGYARSKDLGLNACLMPLDTFPSMRRFLSIVRPSHIILVETELWPIMLSLAGQKNIPVYMVNARLSKRSLRYYRAFKKFWQLPLAAISHICAQSAEDVHRFASLGLKAQNCQNLKFCLQLPPALPKARSEWGYTDDDLIITWGSSRPGEEKLIVSIFNQLTADFPNLKLILVPRHLKRIPEIKKLLGSAYQTFSEIPITKNILLVDKMGILNKAYSLSDITIIGGSFYDFGGHNPLEAAFYSKPIIMGEYHASCRSSVQKLLSEEAIIIANADNLKSILINLLNNQALRQKMGQNAYQTLQKNADSVRLHMRYLTLCGED